MVDGIGTKMDNINGQKCRIMYINVNHLVRFYDVVDLKRNEDGMKIPWNPPPPQLYPSFYS